MTTNSPAKVIQVSGNLFTLVASKRLGLVSLIAAAAAAAYIVFVVWVWPFTMDDAYISFWYAEHIGDGIGPIWNLAVRANPVEGFTSSSHVWLLGGLSLVTGTDTG